MSEKKIYLSPPHLSGREADLVSQALATNWIAPVGPFVDQFEKMLSDVTGSPSVASTNSGTSAIHLALLSLGVKNGDEVLCSSFTFCATANPIVYCNATPVFVDSEPETWNMDPGLLEEAINDRVKKTGRRPKAIIVVHLYGMPAKIASLVDIAHRYGIPLIEDAAEGLGSKHKGRQLGTIGATGILSFNGNKIVTTSGGGALLTSDTSVFERAIYFRQEAREPVVHYEHRSVGYNYRLSNILAAVGCAQLESLQDRLDAKREIFSCYQRELQDTDVAFQPEEDGSYSNRWLTAIVVGEGRKETVRLALEQQNIESRPLWKPMHLQPVFSGCPAYISGTAQHLFERGLCLPSGTSLGPDDLARIIEIIKTQLK